MNENRKSLLICPHSSLYSQHHIPLLPSFFSFSLTAMAARIIAAARQTASINRISSHPPLTQLVQRRGLAGSAGHGPPKVDCWKEPMNPGNWKEEHFVIVSLSGWGLLIYGGFKLFSGGDAKKQVVEASH